MLLWHQGRHRTQRHRHRHRRPTYPRLLLLLQQQQQVYPHIHQHGQVLQLFLRLLVLHNATRRSRQLEQFKASLKDLQRHNLVLPPSRQAEAPYLLLPKLAKVSYSESFPPGRSENPVSDAMRRSFTLTTSKPEAVTQVLAKLRNAKLLIT